MARGVKPGTKRKPYQKKSAEELKKAKEARVAQAEMVLDQYLEPAYRWTRDWKSTQMHANLYLASFAGLTEARAARVLGVAEKELLEAFKAFPETKSHWDRGQEEIVTMCHLALTQRIRGMKVTETRTTTKADGGVDQTVVVKELPPDIDAVKYFLSNRLPEYQEQSASAQFEGRLDTMLSRIEQMDLFE